jgi:starch phosphorylase
VQLGSISPEEVAVELFYGRLDAQKRIQEPATEPMTLSETKGRGVHGYRGTVPCARSGMHGFTVRIRPAHPDSNNVFCTGLMTWK